MARTSTRLKGIGLGKESVRGTSVAATVWYPVLEFNFRDNIDKIMNESRFGVLDKNSARHIVKQWGEGDMTGAIYINAFGHILNNFFGQTPTTTTVETTAKKHVWTKAQTNSDLTHTISTDDANEDLRFAMGMIDTLKIDYVKDDYVKFTATFMSKKSASASNTPAYTVEAKFLPSHAVIKTAATGSSNLTAASALTNIVSLSLEFKKNLVQATALGSSDLEGLYNTDFEATGTIERYYDDTTFRTYARNNTERSLRVDLIDTATIVGAVTNPSLRFDFEQVSFDFPEDGDQDGLATETINLTALWNSSASKTVTAELTNATASF